MGARKNIPRLAESSFLWQRFAETDAETLGKFCEYGKRRQALPRLYLRQITFTEIAIPCELLLGNPLPLAKFTNPRTDPLCKSHATGRPGHWLDARPKLLSASWRGANLNRPTENGA